MTTKSLDQKVNELLDREAIRQLPARYCHYVRTRNIQAIIDIFADNAVFDIPIEIPESGAIMGREALERSYRKNIGTLDPWPFTHNHVVELDGPDEAIGFVYAEIRMGSQDLRVVYMGVYADAYVKERGEWKFKSRKLTLTAIP